MFDPLPEITAVPNTAAIEPLRATDQRDRRRQKDPQHPDPGQDSTDQEQTEEVPHLLDETA